MIIKKIIIENIRSYEYQEVNLKKGSTLLAGDIGSGKTSILLAIEFGLFGLQPGQRGSVLLRNDKNFGGVKILFEVDSKEYFIERTLKRAKTVSQDYAAITINGEKTEMSVTELKSKVLEILNYPQELSKKQNILYKFTVYTPQEEMKQIILEDSDTRLNTLRHVFGIDKYKRILENIGVVRLKIREEKRLLQGAVLSLDSDIDLLIKKEKVLEEKNEAIFSLTEDLLLKAEERKKSEIEKENISEKIKEKSNINTKLGQTQGLLQSKLEIYNNNEKIKKEFEEDIKKFELTNFDPFELQKIEEEILIKKKQKEKLSEMNIAINSELATYELKIKDCEKLESKMQNLEVCPTCYQKVDAVYRANILNKNHNDISFCKRKIEESILEKDGIKKKIKDLEISIDLLEKKNTELKILKMKFEGINEKKEKLEKLKKENYAIEDDIHLLKKQSENLKSSLLEFSKYDNIYEEKTKLLQEKLKEERKSDIKLAESKKEIEMQELSIEELKNRIKKTKEIKLKLDYFVELENWINRKFIPLISFVEKNFMANLKHDFSELFSDWFSRLVPEGLSVRLGDNFTPIIEQKDFEIDYAYLSGGERTAIALAYRLALNQVINSMMSKIKTKELMILDEPTDGFSSQQLDKMREVLDELNAKQLIIVSHEQKIEGFVENVIKFEKEYGISKKTN